ncbi:MAG: bacteriohemerythrin [Bacillota bacterium]
MEWTNDLSVGVTKIDAQHKQLIMRVNAFFDAVETSTANQEVLKVLKFLEAYVVTHFQDEEALQLEYRYPQYQQHKKIHEDFIKTVHGIMDDIRKNGFTAVTQTLVGTTLINWLVTHIKNEDKKVGQHIRNCA